jgi:multiple sugar transport system substrate-binding protein
MDGWSGGNLPQNERAGGDGIACWRRESEDKQGRLSMRKLSRRSVIRGSLGIATTGTIARPFIANAAAITVSVWWPQGFIPEEDASFRGMVAEYEKASGNKIDYSLIPFAPLMQKIVSALTSGEVPDVMSHNIADAAVVPQNAWNDKLVDLTDVVDTQRSQYHPTALLAARYYNNTTKQRSYYYVPYRSTVLPFHIWNSLVEKAGYKLSDAPKTWDAFWDFFKPMQAKLRDKGMRGVYALGLQPTTTGPADGNALFHHFLIAYGGNGIVAPDGRPHLNDPQVKEAVIKALTYITTAYKEGYVPPGALSWNDADDNNAFHAKQMIMDLDGTISTELALFHKKEEYNDIVTIGPAARQRWQADSCATRGGRRIYRQGSEERRRGQGVPEVRDPAERGERISEERLGPLPAGDAGTRQERPILARSQGPTPSGLHPRGRIRSNGTELPRLQPRIC